MGTSIQGYGQARRGGIRAHCIVSEGPEQQPGQQPDVGDAFDELLRSTRQRSITEDFVFSGSLGTQQMVTDERDQKCGLVDNYTK